MGSKSTECVKAFGFACGAKSISPGKPRSNRRTPAFRLQVLFPAYPLWVPAAPGSTYCSGRTPLCLLWLLLYFMQHSYVLIVNSRRETGSRLHLSSTPTVSSPEVFLR